MQAVETEEMGSASPRLKELRSEADAFIAKPAASKQILFKVSGVLKGTRQ
jgi:hypothetical protein